MSNTSGPSVPDSSGRLVDLFDPSRVTVTLRVPLVTRCPCKRALPPAVPAAGAKLWRQALSRNLRTRSNKSRARVGVGVHTSERDLEIQGAAWWWLLDRRLS